MANCLGLSRGVGCLMPNLHMMKIFRLVTPPQHDLIRMTD